MCEFTAWGTLEQFENHSSSQWGIMERSEAGEWHDSDVHSKKITLEASWSKDESGKARDKRYNSEMASTFQE